MLRRTPLQRRGFLPRGAGLKRSPMKRTRGRTKAERRSEWTEANGRARVADRSKCCEKCGAGGVMHWHHRKRRSQGGTWAPSNGLRLCPPCHGWVHANPDEAKEHGWLVDRDADPAAVPFEHWQWGPVLIDDDTTDYHRKGEAA
ncbi:HNH endonuclease signature motif containing protein [Amycolatopsis jejuensis]|uniref:HNH endonuclease signature motif containing protein n=1 Tax=Amycolatopsis jejuensis TaxID=330084 RepID=UPI0012E02013|nr:HNH endonuclease signature motif containing protein [Amycolatopsis jejuensis]